MVNDLTGVNLSPIKLLKIGFDLLKEPNDVVDGVVHFSELNKNVLKVRLEKYKISDDRTDITKTISRDSHQDSRLYTGYWRT